MGAGSRGPSWASPLLVCGACLALLLAACAPVSARQPVHAQQTAGELIDIIASPTSSHEQRWKAVQALRTRGGDAAPGLLRILPGADAKGSKYYTIRALGYLKDRRATQALSTILLDRGYGPRRYAAIALGQIRDPKAVEALTKALTDVPYVRADALDALVKIDSSESRKALGKYHFGGTDPRLKLHISCEPRSVTVGDRLTVRASLTNVGKQTIRLAVSDGKPVAYLVVQRAGDGFVESIDTGQIEDRVAAGPSVFELKPGAEIKWQFTGVLQKWTKGEKDDNTFVPTVKPFLTLGFGIETFHVRQPGDYSVRVVLKQEEEPKKITRGRLGGEGIKPLKVVSNSAILTVRAP